MRTRDRKPPSQGSPPVEAISSEDAARAAVIQAEIDRAVAPYVGLLPPAAIHAFRERAAAYLASDPQMTRLLDVALGSSRAQTAVRSVEVEGAAPAACRRRSEKKA